MAQLTCAMFMTRRLLNRSQRISPRFFPVPRRCLSTSTHWSRNKSDNDPKNNALSQQQQKKQSRTPTALWSALIFIGLTTTYYVTGGHVHHLDGGKQLPFQKERLISYDEVQAHVTEEDCWVIVQGNVYDVTQFLELHPGGKKAILALAGSDASALFDKIHPAGTLATLPPDTLVGPIDLTTVPEPKLSLAEELESQRIADAREEMPDADAMFLLQEFEEWAHRTLTDKAWAYYRSAADEERSFHENRDAFQRYFFRPRILRGSHEGTIETTILGCPSAMPIFISPAAMAKLGHPRGEVNLTEAAGDSGIIQIISANASCSLDEMFAAKKEDQKLMYQVYMNKDRSISKSVLRDVERRGAAAIVFTVDVAWQSKRTLDVRTQSTETSILGKASPKNTADRKHNASVSAAIGSYQDRNLTWDDISFIRQNTRLPIIVKGVQCLEDVELCVKHGVEGVILSNHGGRQADYAPASIDVLYEVRSLRPDLFDKIEIMIDGGIRSGADVVKAVALGAKAVGVGRPILYANGTHGKDGVTRVLEILQEEVTNTLRNIGVSDLKDLRPEMVGPAGPWIGRNRPKYLNSSGTQ